MALYAYIKKSQKSSRLIRDKSQKSNIKDGDVNNLRGLSSVFSSIFLVLGLILIGSVIYPLGKWWFNWIKQENTAIVSPIPDRLVAGAMTVNANLRETETQSDIDYTKVSSWFPNAKPQSKPASRVTHYNLSIPKFKIKDAVVEIAGEDLKKSLIHYGGTAMPGDYGNAVIFGHSTLPQFFNPKNYVSIFSRLEEIKEGDEIFVDYDGILYKYLVSEKEIVEAEDTSVLEQRYDNSYLTLVTCVPPGTYWKRLVVRAKIEKI